MRRQLHAAAVARLFDYRRVEQQGTVFALMLRESPERAADLIRELDTPVAVGLLGDLPDAQVASIIAELDSDDAAEIIPAMPEEQAERVLDIMKDSASAPIAGLLAYEEETAGRTTSPAVVALEEQVPVGVDGAARSTSRYWRLRGNTRSYAGVGNVTHLAAADDGRLDFCLLEQGGLPRIAWLLPWVLLRRHHQRAHMQYRQVESLEVRTAGLPVQVDGEYLTETPIRIEVAPRALQVIVPAGLRSPLFTSDAP